MLLAGWTQPAGIGASRLMAGLALLLGLGACDGASKPASSLEVADKGAFSAALSADGSYAVVGSLTHGGSLWDVDTGERRFNWNHRAGEYSPITSAAISPDAGYAITAADNSLVAWNTASGAALTFFSAPAQVLSLALGPQGEHALLGLSDDSAVLFDALKGGILRVFPHQGRVRSVALNRDATLALTGSEDDTARLWDVASGRELQRWEHAGDVRLVALSGDGARALSVSKYDRAALWDTSTGLETGSLPVSRWRTVRGETFTAAAFSADGTRLLTGTTDHRVQLWQLPTLRQIETWELPRRADWKRSGAYVLAVGFSSDDRLLLCVSADGFIHRLAL
ncbi:MAG: hypothetical protein KBG75_06105 [Pseudomonadales bacterium]|nr:hypothetical protein [Pseudomonadales bacterium]